MLAFWLIFAYYNIISNNSQKKKDKNALFLAILSPFKYLFDNAQGYG